MGAINITNASVERLQHPQAGQQIYFDDKLKGFGVCVGKSSKAFFVQRRVDKKIKRENIARFGVLTAAEAREQARKWLYEQGLPVEEREKKVAATISLDKAWERYQQLLSAKNRSATTLTNYTRAIKYLEDWLPRPLASITRDEVRRRHQQLAKEINAGKHAPNGRARRGRDGKRTANFTFSVFRLVYNKAMVAHKELPANPVCNVDWFEVDPPRTSMSLEEIPTWWTAVGKIENVVRRDLLKFLLMTGLRRQSAQVMEWERNDKGNWVDFPNRLLHLNFVKGGKKKAYDLPLSQWHIDLLQARKEGNSVLDSKWVWVSPSSKSGHVSEPWVELKGVARQHNLHDLRRTWATVAEQCIDLHLVSALMNHSQLKGITGRYVTHDADRLRGPMDQVVARLLSIVEPDTSDKNVIPIRKAAA